MNWKKILPDALCVVLFALIAVVYFYPALDGKVLTGHDHSGADGLSVEINSYREAHSGETPRWINSIFSGMPTYQIAPSYDSVKPLTAVESAWHLWLPDYVWFIFASMLGFYILLRAFDFKQWMAALGAVVWAFSTYFLIIIAAGHIWKVMTLAYIPPTIAGMVLLYRGKWLWGLLVTALFAALQIKSNHVQMTYYFLIVEICLVIAFFIDALRKKQMARFLKATALLVVAAIVAVAVNASNLYHTYEYAKDTMRGKSELVKAGEDQKKQTSSGLDRDYITAWSYGVGETWTLLIPNVKGGASVPIQASDKLMGKADPQFSQMGVYAAFTQYFGEQPGTSGPVYVGAIVCMLFILSLLILPKNSALKWALLIATILSILLAWGHNFMPFTNFFIDHVPMYAKFRTVSSILVVAEFTIPLLALLGLKAFVEGCLQSDKRVAMLRALVVSAAICAVVCIAFAIVPSLGGECLSLNDRHIMTEYVSRGYLDQGTANRILESVASLRASMVSSDAWRSLLFIALGAVALYWYFSQSGKSLQTSKKSAKQNASETTSNAAPATILSVILLALCLIDLWQVNKRYLNDDMFVDKPMQAAAYIPTEPEQFVLQKDGNGRNYRVLNFAVSTFNDNTPSFNFSNIGGYHAAKLRRYQELIERHIAPEMHNVYQAVGEARLDTAGMVASGDLKHPLYDFSQVKTDSLYPVLNMLNTRWFFLGNGNSSVLPIENPAAFGNAWFVHNVKQVGNANEEIDALGKENLHETAVILAGDDKDAAALPATFEADSAATITQTELTSTSVTYETSSAKDALAVFSEIYYPGWTATIDGKDAHICRANYVLRAMLVPAGKHTIKMTFDPQSVKTTETIAYVALIALLAIAIILILNLFRKKKAQETDEAEGSDKH